MNASRTTTVQAKNLSEADESKPGFRTKTISTRLHPDELAEVEAGAERAGQPLSEWLRETALRAARERPADPVELLLAEIWAVRHMVLGLFHAGAQATVDGKPDAASIDSEDPRPNRLQEVRGGAPNARRFRRSACRAGWQRTMNRRPILLILVQFLAFAAIAQAVTVWIFWRPPWTPLQRHYLPVYIWCSLPVISPATVEVRLIWKTGRHRKRELAMDDDAVDSGDGTGIALSQSATDAGWKTLIKGPPQQIPAEMLRPDLANLVFEGQSLGDFLLLPELSAIAALCISIGAWFLVIGFFRALATELAWRRRVSAWQGPSPGFFDMCRSFLDECRVLTGRACSGLAVLHRNALRRTDTYRAAPSTTTCRPETAAEPPAKPASFAFPTLRHLQRNWRQLSLERKGRDRMNESPGPIRGLRSSPMLTISKPLISQPGADLPQGGICLLPAELLEPRPARFQ